MESKSGWLLGSRHKQTTSLISSPFALAAAASLDSIGSHTTVDEVPILVPASEYRYRNAHLFAQKGPSAETSSASRPTVEPITLQDALTGTGVSIPTENKPKSTVLADILIVPDAPSDLLANTTLRTRIREAYDLMASHFHTTPFWKESLVPENFQSWFIVICAWSARWWLDSLCGPTPPSPEDSGGRPFIENALGVYWKMLVSSDPQHKSVLYFGKATGAPETGTSFGLGLRRTINESNSIGKNKGKESKHLFNQAYRKHPGRYTLIHVSIFAIPFDDITTASDAEITSAKLCSAFAEALFMFLMQNWNSANKHPRSQRSSSTFWQAESFSTIAMNFRNPLSEPLDKSLYAYFPRAAYEFRERATERERIRLGHVKRYPILSESQKEIRAIATLAKLQNGRILARQKMLSKARLRRERATQKAMNAAPRSKRVRKSTLRRREREAARAELRKIKSPARHNGCKPKGSARKDLKRARKAKRISQRTRAKIADIIFKAGLVDRIFKAALETQQATEESQASQSTRGMEQSAHQRTLEHLKARLKREQREAKVSALLRLRSERGEATAFQELLLKHDEDKAAKASRRHFASLQAKAAAATVRVQLHRQALADIQHPNEVARQKIFDRRLQYLIKSCRKASGNRVPPGK